MIAAFFLLSPSGRRRRESGSRQAPFCLAAAAATPAIFFLAACDTSKPLELRSEMKLEGAVRLEGPITIQMSGPEIRYEGTYVSEDLYKRIEIGKTSRLWAVTVIGEPDRRSEMADGSELLVWSYKLGAITGKIVEVMDMGGEEGKRPATLTTVVRFVDGIAQEKWRG